jgi:transcriptional regulator with XRE-family HTH domain
MHSSYRAQLRKRVGLTQVRLAKLVGISQTRLSFWENDEAHLSAIEIQRIARILWAELSLIRVVASPDDLYSMLCEPNSMLETTTGK